MYYLALEEENKLLSFKPSATHCEVVTYVFDDNDQIEDSEADLYTLEEGRHLWQRQLNKGGWKEVQPNALIKQELNR